MIRTLSFFVPFSLTDISYMFELFYNRLQLFLTVKNSILFLSPINQTNTIFVVADLVNLVLYWEKKDQKMDNGIQSWSLFRFFLGQIFKVVFFCLFETFYLLFKWLIAIKKSKFVAY